jgi:ATP-dependent Clp protease ATP-binding subunit ClpA
VFERYTESARRTVFHARLTATEFGRTEIETEHLLVGLLHDSAFANQFLPGIPVNDLKDEIWEKTLFKQRLDTSVDMPLSNELKRALAYASQEAERLAHRHIGNEHLLLGILRESRCLAAQLLTERGIDAQELRTRLVNVPESQEATFQARPGRSALHDTVEIHDEMWDETYVREQAEALKRFYWRLADWRPVDVVEHEGRISFDLSLAEEQSFQRVPQGWTRDACAICRWELNASGEESHSKGYTNGREWLCVECYEKFLSST